LKKEFIHKLNVAILELNTTAPAKLPYLPVDSDLQTCKSWGQNIYMWARNNSSHPPPNAETGSDLSLPQMLLMIAKMLDE
jgi:hypothetical protein